MKPNRNNGAETTTVSTALAKLPVSSRSHRGVKRCAEWLAYCLDIGWDKSQIDELEALWWKYHDEHGNLVRRNGG